MKLTAQQLRVRYKALSIKNLVTRLRVIRYQILTSGDNGFTLVEILVAITILATLAGGVMLSLNPIAQINKGQDAQKTSDLQAIKTALELYYDDNNCYPTEVPFGIEWHNDGTVYMKKVPQDPQCKNGSGTCYRYRTDAGTSNNCPQWNVVFAELSKASSLANTCPLSSLSTSSCTPTGYSSGKFACVMSGAVDCGTLALLSITGGNLETVQPTPTPNPCNASSNRQNECACTINNQCASQNCDLTVPNHTGTNLCKPSDEAFDPFDLAMTLPQDTTPDPYQLIINNGTNQIEPNPGGAQAIKLKILDPGVPITSVEVVIYSDTYQKNVFLNPPTGKTNNAGTWSGTRAIDNDDTYSKKYSFEFIIKAGTAPNELIGYEGVVLKATGL